MRLAGSGIGIANFKLRFFVLVFFGIAALGSVLYWRQKTLLASTYAEFPIHNKTASKGDLRSKNFQIEVQDTSPSVK